MNALVWLRKAVAVVFSTETSELTEPPDAIGVKSAAKPGMVFVHCACAACEVTTSSIALPPSSALVVRPILVMSTPVYPEPCRR